ncbi:uncharacterized protein LOC34622180 [Cyclospora cayetanensis]|uniref:Uncharacterized protein LOC34622180 n=1 Tax=Cyclospora cayetanensis TaxID=88456 RepID=A0A6P6RV00_9EIME|nr:uncharacterized protein LOC34622180 [Cyclospora cayetanensis]
MALMMLSLGYQLGAFTAPSLVVVSGGRCCESSSGSDSSSRAADLLQMRRWIHLAKEWAPCLTLKPLLCAEEAPSAILLPHPEEGTPNAAAATAAAAAAAPSYSALHASASGEPPEAARPRTVETGGPLLGSPQKVLYITTFGALGGHTPSSTLRELRRQHPSLSVLIVDSRCRRQCDRLQRQQQQQQQQQYQQQGESDYRASQCCSALHSEASITYASMAAVDIYWGSGEVYSTSNPSGERPREKTAPAARGRVKKLIIADYPVFDSYMALRFLLPHLLPVHFSSPAAVDRLALRSASSASVANDAAAAPPPTAAASEEDALTFSRRCAFPLILRRSRASVLIRELPPPNRILHRLSLSPAQEAQYAAIEAACTQRLLAAAGAASTGETEAAAAARGLLGYPGEDIETITTKAVAAMRLTCIHPALVASCSAASSSEASRSCHHPPVVDYSISLK